MAILLFVLFLILFIVFIISADKTYYEDVFMILSILSGCSVVVASIAIIVFGILIINGKTIDKRIDMYTEQNQKIEESISDLVENYMNYESSTFKDLSPDSAITLVSLYPELKSDTLVEQQCNLYMENNKKITELKEEKINLTIYKWWLYFGK